MAATRQFHVAADAERIVLRPEGRCTAVLGDAIGRYIKRLPEGSGRELYVDLSAAEMIESTFAGLLLSLALRRDGAAAVSLHLLRPSGPVVAALANMNVLRFFDVCDGLATPPASWTAMAVDCADPKELAELIVRAHEGLIAADSRNAAAFGGVVRCFKESASGPPESGA